MNLIRPLAEMEVEAGRQDLGHLDNSNSNSSHKEKEYHEEVKGWREQNQENKEQP